MKAYRVNSLSCGRSLIGRAAILAAFASVSVPVFAQDPAHEAYPVPAEEDIIWLEPVTVTAQKREQASTDVPIAMTVYEGGYLSQLQIQDMADLSTYVPGFEVQLQSPNNPGFAMRGVTTDSGDAYSEARVSIYQDGVSISKSRGSVVELFDMGRIEVLKGPQSTLFGRGASSGALSLISNKPRNITDGELTVGIGNFGSYSVKGYYNAPIIEDKLLARAAFSFRHRDGYIENLAEGADDDLNGAEVIAVRPSVRYLFGGGGTFDLVFNYQYDDYTGTSFLQKIYAPEGKSKSDIYNYGELNRGDDLGIQRTVWSFTGTFEQPINDNMTLTSITAYRQFDSDEEFDADGTQAYILECAEDARGKQWSQELRVNWKAGDSLEGFFGGNIFYSKAETRVPVRTDERALYAHLSPTVAASINPGITALNTALAPLGVNLPLVQAQYAIIDGIPNTSNSTLPYGMFAAMSIQAQLAAGVPASSLTLPDASQLPTLSSYHEEEYTNYGTQTAYELFGDTTWKITEKLSLTAGLRVTHEEIESGYRVDAATPSYLAMIVRGASTPGNIMYATTDGKITESADYTSAVGRLVLEYALAKDLNLYTSYSRGRRPPVISVVDTGTNPTFKKLNAETIDSFETGFKSFLFNRRAQLEGSVYYYQYKDFATSVYRDLTQVVESAGDADTKGAELSANVLIMPGWTAFANYAWIEGQFNGDDTVYKGNTFRLTPKNSFSVGTNFLMPTNIGNIFITPSYTWKSRVYFTEDPNETALSQEAYGLLNLRFGISHKSWTLSFFVKNMLDEEYIIDAGNSGDNIGLPTFIAGTPRTFGAEYTYRF